MIGYPVATTGVRLGAFPADVPHGIGGSPQVFHSPLLQGGPREPDPAPRCRKAGLDAARRRERSHRNHRFSTGYRAIAAAETRPVATGHFVSKSLRGIGFHDFRVLACCRKCHFAHPRPCEEVARRRPSVPPGGSSRDARARIAPGKGGIGRSTARRRKVSHRAERVDCRTTDFLRTARNGSSDFVEDGVGPREYVASIQHGIV